MAEPVTQAQLFQQEVDKINTDTPLACLRSFISILDGTDESENGVIFHPVQIGSVRVLESAKLEKVLNAMRKFSDGEAD